MIVYAESSAVLAWLCGESQARTIRAVLAKASVVVASELTLIECDRVLIRSSALAETSERLAARRRSRLHAAAAH